MRLFAGIAVAVVVLVLVVAGSDPTIDVTEPFSGKLVTAQDARSYYGLNLADLYAGRTNWNTIGAYPYSPAFAQLVYPLNLLPWPMFVAAWTAILIGAVYLLTGPELLLLGLALGAMEIAGGNISLLLTLAIVAGFRWPWTWAFVLLTKITPGRRAAVVRAAARVAAARDRPRGDGGVVAVSFLLMPGAWRTGSPARREHRQGRHVGGGPGPARGARPDRRALLLGRAAEPALDRAGGRDARLPALWYGSLSMVLGVIPLTTPEERRRVWARLRSATLGLTRVPRKDP